MIKKQKKLRFFTGITATGTLTLGHYLGIIKNILKIQEKYEIIIMIGDLHALTVPNNKINFLNNCYEIASLLYSCGLKKNKCKIFIQSSIKEHIELSFFLSSHVNVGKLNNMIQYKEKKRENLSLLYYPVLMASDIFLYDSDLVLVGKDQKQHLELSSDIAKTFNNFYQSKLLKIPKFEIPEIGGKIMSLKNPEKKMSKSEKDNISLLDNYEEIKKKIFSSITDSENKIYYHEKKKGISNLLIIYSLLENKTIKESEMELKNSNYHFFKEKIINSIEKNFSSIKEKYKLIFPEINQILKKNNDYLKKIAKKKIRKIKEVMKLL